MSKIIGMHVPAEVKNYVINGGLDFWQEKGATVTTINTTSTVTSYSSDMLGFVSAGTTVKNYSLARSTDVPTPAQSGFQSTYSALFTMITGISSFASGDIILPFEYRMEGLDYSKIHGKQVTMGFWIKASATGTYSVSIRNSAGTRSYVTTVSVNNPNTHEFKTITLTLDTAAASYSFDNTSALLVNLCTFSGATYQTATLNQWQAGNFTTATTATNYMATSGATVRISQLSIVEGSLGLGDKGFQRAGKNISQELSMCQRYFEKSFPIDFTPANGPDATSFSTFLGIHNTITSNTASGGIVVFKNHKRSTPTFVVYGNNAGNGRYLNPGNASIVYSAQAVVPDTSSVNSVTISQQAIASTLLSVTFHWTADSRL